MVQVVSVNLASRIALLDDGRTMPVTNLFDINGDDTPNPTEAVAFVCGSGREWFSEAVADYDRTRLH